MLKQAFLLLSGSALLLISGAALAQMQRCEINGEDVNPSNGYTTQNKTGIMRCRSEDGKLRREEEVRAGKFMGLRKFHNDDGSYNESNINEQGNRHGRYREFYPGNKLKADENYDNGSSTGLGKRYFENGQVQRVSFHEGGKELAAVEYQKDGKYARVRCAARSLFSEDQAVCGFNGKPIDVALYSTRGAQIAKETYLTGVLQSRIDLDDSGAPARSVQIAHDMRTTRTYFKDGKVKQETAFREAASDRSRDGREGTEKEWAQNGQQIRESIWKRGFQASVTQWYMNGSLKEKQVTDGPERDAIVNTERFWDNGKPQLKETRKGSRPTGKSQSFDESGRLRKEDFYDEKGTLKTRKEFDESGKQVKDEEFYEDGSRKLR